MIDRDRAFAPSGGGFAAGGFAAGGFAAQAISTGPQILQARTAAAATTIMGAAPTHGLHYEEASGAAVDFVGGTVTLTPSAGASRVPSALGDKAGRVPNNGLEFWGASSAAAFEVTTGSFACAGWMTIPAAPSSDLWGLLKYQNGGRGWGILCTQLGHLAVWLFEPTLRNTTIAASHVGAPFAFVFGRHATALRLYLSTSIGNAELVLASSETLTSLGGRAAIPGRHQTDAGSGGTVGVDMSVFLFFEGAAAEAVLADRADTLRRLVA